MRGKKRLSPVTQGESPTGERRERSIEREAKRNARVWATSGQHESGKHACHLTHASYPFFALLAFAVDLTGPLDPTFALTFSDPTFALPFSALVVAAAIRVSDLSVSASRRALCVALRWLTRRFISFALCLLGMGSS